MLRRIHPQSLSRMGSTGSNSGSIVLRTALSCENPTIRNILWNFYSAPPNSFSWSTTGERPVFIEQIGKQQVHSSHREAICG
jgi:hypothetical protein